MPDDKPAPRFGIYEWFGRRVSDLDQETRKQFREEAKKKSPDLPCIPRAGEDGDTPKCNKRGGVCSMRKHVQNTDGETAETTGPIVTVCPERFKEDDLIFEWAAGEILGTEKPWKVNEVDFLKANPHPKKSEVWGDDSEEETSPQNDERDRGVGRIDGVLVNGQHYLDDEFELQDWCGLEIQAVYFSGDAMSTEYPPIAELPKPHLPFPDGTRRPDYRSSSAKRLLPQLQTKVPSMRRWGTKMAVVVDEAFFYRMAKMNEVNDLSNCDIAWIVVRYVEDDNGVSLRKEGIHMTTLEDAVVGLTAGIPVSKDEFEDRLMRQIIDEHAEVCIDHLRSRISENVDYRKRIDSIIEERYRSRKRPLVTRRSELLDQEEKRKLTPKERRELETVRKKIKESNRKMRPWKNRKEELLDKVRNALRDEKRRLQNKEVEGSKHTIGDELWKRHGNRWIRKDRRLKDKCDRPPPSPDGNEE